MVLEPNVFSPCFINMVDFSFELKLRLHCPFHKLRRKHSKPPWLAAGAVNHLSHIAAMDSQFLSFSVFSKASFTGFLARAGMLSKIFTSHFSFGSWWSCWQICISRSSCIERLSLARDGNDFLFPHLGELTFCHSRSSHMCASISFDSHSLTHKMLNN